MLQKLHIKNYVLIDSLEIEFPAGLVIITGQTGAGKSILLGALALALGGKSDAGMIGDKGENCVVEAEFDVQGDVAAQQLIENQDLDWSGGRLVIRRVLSRNGRARAFINDVPVAVSVLHQLSGRLLDIHSQNETQLLTDRNFQLSVLDHFAGNEAAVTRYASQWNRVCQLDKRLSEVEEQLRKMTLEREFNESLLERLESAALREGELEELEAEQKQLANAEEIKTVLCTVGSLFAPEEDEQPSLDAVLKDAVRQLERLSRYLPAAHPLAERIESARLELDDILSEVQELAASTDIAPDRLEAVEERMSLLYGLLKKHGCSEIAGLIRIREQLSRTLSDSTALEEERESLLKQTRIERQQLEAASQELSRTRMQAAPEFSQAILKDLVSLELEYAVFDVQLEEIPLSASGRDRVLFRFSSTGKNPVDVAKCASGGEKSRIMLCLKAMMAQFTRMPSMVFDEIDTGVSGSVADKMGDMICKMGRHMQVFAITHLPQVAAKGNAHFLVTKTLEARGEAVTSIRQISGDSRISEIARLLSGSSITKEAVANARSLLDQNL